MKRAFRAFAILLEKLNRRQRSLEQSKRKSRPRQIECLRVWGEALPLACFVLDHNLRVIWSNSKSKNIFKDYRDSDIKNFAAGYSPTWIHPDDAADAIALFRGIRQTNNLTAVTKIRVLGNDKDWMCLQIKLTTIKFDVSHSHRQSPRSSAIANRKLTLGTCEDVTLFENAIDALRDRQLRAKRLLSGIRDAAVLVLCENGFIQFCNEAVTDVLGYSKDELTGKHISFLSPKTELLSGKILRSFSLADERNFHEEVTRRIRKSGEGFWASVLVTSLPAEPPYSKNYCVVIRDVSEAKREERELQEWKKRFEQLAENVKEAFWIYDVRSATLDYISPVFKQLLGIDPHIGNLFFSEILRKSHPNDMNLVRNFISDLTLGNDSRIEFRRTHLNEENLITSHQNEHQWISFKSFAVRDSAGRVHRMVGVAEDITESKNAQIALKEAKDAADTANQAKSEFLANMSHEIRTPLGAMMGFAEIVGNFQNSDEEKHEALQAILRNGHQLNKIIDEILDLSKVEAGKLELEEEAFELIPFMSDVTTLLSLQAREKGISLKIEQTGILPKSIRTDGTKFRQILINIVGNAVKFTDKGTVSIDLSTELHLYRTKLFVRVTDTGPGLSQEQQKRLFQPFVQADSSTRRRFGGTGLGLVLSRRLANLLGGDLQILWSILGKGSCFEISLSLGPACNLDFSEAPDTLNHVSRPARNKNTSVRLDGFHILVVDDAPDNRLIVQKFLTHSGATVEHAADGRSAAQRALKQNFDLIVMDIQMPEFDGYETVSYLRKRGYKKPIIALSAHAMREDRERSLAFGFNEHLSKPVDRNELLTHIQALLPKIEPKGLNNSLQDYETPCTRPETLA
jgi:PAS domain S-box-containing protein